MFYRPSPGAGLTPIKTSLVPVPGRTGWWRSAADSWTVQFGPRGQERLVEGERSVSFVPVRRPSKVTQPVVRGSSLVYRGIWSRVDESYRVSTAGVSDALMVRSAGSPSRFEYRISAGARIRRSSAGGAVVEVGGRVVASVPPPTVIPGAGMPAKGADPSLRVADGGRMLVLAVSGKWLSRLPARAFPVVIDPGLYADLSPTQGGLSTFSVDNRGQVVTNNGSALEVGVDSSGLTWRSAVFFNWSQYLGQSNPWIPVNVSMELLDQSGSSSGVDALSFYDLTQGFANGTSDNGYSEIPQGSFVQGTVDGFSVPTNNLTQSLASAFSSGSDFVFGLTGNEAGSASSPTQKIYGYAGGPVELNLQLASKAPAATVLSPVPSGGATVATVDTATPQITASYVTDTFAYAGGSTQSLPVYYDYRVSTGANGVGRVADSGWLDNTQTWSVPAGALRDGEDYYEEVLTENVVSYDATPNDPPAGLETFSAPVELAVKLRAGAGGPSPTDTVGSVPGSTSTPSAGAPSPGLPPASETVNLVTGNLALTAGTHAVDTAAGSFAPSLSYNSLDAGSYGLNGDYYEDPYGTHSMSGNGVVEVGQRTDPSIDFDWSGGLAGAQPISGIATTTAYLVQWSGYIDIPSTGDWALGVSSAGGARACLDATGCSDSDASPDAWTGGTANSSPMYGTPVSETAGYHHVIVQAWENPYAGWAQLYLGQYTSTGTGWTQTSSELVPSNFLSPTAQTLPAGWSLSTGNLSLAYSGVIDDGNQVLVQRADGSTDTFSSAWNGSYVPPAGDSDVLTRGVTGQLSLETPAGQVYNFTSTGAISSVTAAPDTLNPSAMTYTYGPTGQILSATDPVSARSTNFVYGGSSSCPAQTSDGVATDASAGMLCALVFEDGTTTTFAYNSNGQLAEIDDPGTVVSRFGYDAADRLDDILDPLAYAAIAAGDYTQGTSTDTTIAYIDSAASCTTIITACAAVSTVTQPQPTPGSGTAATTRTYTYGTGTTSVAVTGLTGVTGRAESVTYDSAGQITSKTDAAGGTTTTIWDSNDDPLVTIGPNGEQTSTVYNSQYEPVEVYGPAPTACFSLAPPYLPATSSTCTVPVPVTQTSYDTGISGLAASWFASHDATGPPCRETTDASGPSHSWGTTVPYCDATNGDWSLRETGLIDLPVAGSYTFDLQTEEGADLYIDNSFVGVAGSYVDQDGSWGPVYTFTVNVTAPGWQPVRLDYFAYNGPAGSGSNGVRLSYQPPGGSMVPVPASVLDPNYGYVTQTVDPDGDTTQTTYGNLSIDPVYGLVTSVTRGAGSSTPLTTSTAYETPGATGSYDRRTATVLPAGNATTYSYYCGQATGADCNTRTEQPGALANTCGVATGASQYGLLEQQTDPAPSPTGQPRVQQFVYSPAGQMVGRRVNAASFIAGTSWQCIAYDSLGRMTSESWPAFNGAAARTVTYNYAVGRNPLVNSVTDPTGTISSTVDLLGRTVSYTDAEGNTTSTTYNQDGSVASASGEQGSTTDAYNNGGQLTTVAYNTTTLATVTYDTTLGDPGFEQPTSIAYTNNVTAVYAYDAYGHQDQVSYNESGSTLAGDQTIRDEAGRETKDYIDTLAGTGYNANPGGNDFAYDAAGRLTTAYLYNEKATYSYAANPASDNCAVAPINGNAGANTNRTSVTITPNGGSPTTTDYCYNTADQLTSTVTNGVSTSTYTYDTHGNQLRDGTNTYTWDSADRLATATSGTTASAVAYTDDALNRTLTRTDSTGTTSYLYAGETDTPAATINGTVITPFVDLPGGVQVAYQAKSIQTWSVPNLQGDDITTFDAQGFRAGRIITYDPWGNRYSATGILKNTSSNQTLGAYAADGKLTENDLATPIITMSARSYNPSDARFLQPDPIQGGCADVYTYAFGDPLNQPDLTGQWTYCHAFSASTIYRAGAILATGGSYSEAFADIPGISDALSTIFKLFGTNVSLGEALKAAANAALGSSAKGLTQLAVVGIAFKVGVSWGFPPSVYFGFDIAGFSATGVSGSGSRYTEPSGGSALSSENVCAKMGY